MIAILIKSTLCMLLLLVVYKLFLEKEKMHQFNRFFLLFSLVISLATPFVTIEVYEEISTNPISHQMLVEETTIAPSSIIIEQSVNYLPFIWSIYGIISLVFIIRFLKNFNQIKKRIKSNLKINTEEATLVLIPEKILPHTFLNYIFINKSDFENRNIEEELYTHELTHVRQRHTLDVLFVEVLKTIFWFNPILILYKKAIQLNHEFLADEKVVSSYNISFYQKLLLEKASWKNNYHLVSNLNFLVTKKRLIMMTKTTSNNTAVIKKLILAPILVGIIYFTCTKTIAQEKKVSLAKAEVNRDIKAVDDKEKRRATYFAGVRFIIYDKGVQTKDGLIKGKIVFDKIYEEFTPEDKERCKAFLFTQDGFKKNAPSQKEFEDFKNSKKYAIWVDGKNVKNSALNKYKPSDIAYFSGSVILKNAKTKKHPQPFQYLFFTQDHFDKNEMGKATEKYDDDKIEIFLSSPKEKSKETATISTTEIANIEETKPEFPGGQKEFGKFLQKEFKMPIDFIGRGDIVTNFIVEEDGTLSNIKIISDLGKGTGEAILKFLEKSPKWIPGTKNGKNVKMELTLPIRLVSVSNDQ